MEDNNCLHINKSADQDGMGMDQDWNQVWPDHDWIRV